MKTELKNNTELMELSMSEYIDVTGGSEHTESIVYWFAYAWRTWGKMMDDLSNTSFGERTRAGR